MPPHRPNPPAQPGRPGNPNPPHVGRPNPPHVVPGPPHHNRPAPVYSHRTWHRYHAPPHVYYGPTHVHTTWVMPPRYVVRSVPVYVSAPPVRVWNTAWQDIADARSWVNAAARATADVQVSSVQNRINRAYALLDEAQYLVDRRSTFNHTYVLIDQAVAEADAAVQEAERIRGSLWSLADEAYQHVEWAEQFVATSHSAQARRDLNRAYDALQRGDMAYEAGQVGVAHSAYRDATRYARRAVEAAQSAPGGYLGATPAPVGGYFGGYH